MLGDRLKGVVMQRDHSNGDVFATDPHFQRTVGAFYGHYINPTFQRQLKDNRKVEELIIGFVTSATGVLKKTIAGDEWKGELLAQVGLFVRLVGHALREVRHVPPELTSRLDVYLSKLGPAPLSKSVSRESDYVNVQAPSPTPMSIAEMELVRQVAVVFSVAEDQLARDIVAIKRFCTEKVRGLHASELRS